MPRRPPSDDRLDWPLARNQVTRRDLDCVIELLGQADATLTPSSHVRELERRFCQRLGVRYSVFVNSGSSANLLTLAALRAAYGTGKVIVPAVTWVSGIAAVLHHGFTPDFVDIHPPTLGMDHDDVIAKLTPDTKAVFLTHVLGFNGLSQRLLDALSKRRITLLEDVGQSHGATFLGKPLGSTGQMSTFSFGCSEFSSTIEGGMICTSDPELYEIVRMLCSEGMVRAATSEAVKQRYWAAQPELHPDFIVAYPGYQARGTEIQAVLSLAQLERLNDSVAARNENCRLFLSLLDGALYRSDFHLEGCSNQCLPLVLRHADTVLRDRVKATLRRLGVGFRRGIVGGGNQLRQPYLQRLVGEKECQRYAEAEHVHFYGFTLGNYPELEKENIARLCSSLNALTTRQAAA